MPMKIELIAPTYLPARRANTIQVMKMAQALAVCGYSVEVIAPDPKIQNSRVNEEERKWVNLAQHYGLEIQFPVIWLPTQPGWRNYDFGLRAVQLARKSQADLIYTRLPQAAAVASQMGIPTIHEIHDYPRSLASRTLLRLFLRGQGARRLVSISQALTDDIKAGLGVRIQKPFSITAPDGVDLNRYAALPSPGLARQELGLQDRFTVGYTGHLYSGRGIEFILDLATRLPEVNFLLAGGEPDSVQHWRGLAAQRQLTNLTLTGFISNTELPRYQAACDILLMPYRRHVAASSGGDIGRYLSPMKLFEYLACGRVILSSDLPVFHEVLNSANAILLPPEDHDAWVEAIQIGLQFPEQYARLSERAQRDALQYTWTARVQKIFINL